MLRMELHARLRSVCCALLFVHSMREISSCTGDEQQLTSRKEWCCGQRKATAASRSSGISSAGTPK